MKMEIKVPAMGESISEAIVGVVLKPSGSKVAADEEILELETDKVNQVLYAPQAGVITINVLPEEHVTIGQVIGFVDGDAKADEPPQQPEFTAPKQPGQPKVESSKGRITREAYVEELLNQQKNPQNELSSSSFVQKAAFAPKPPPLLPKPISSSLSGLGIGERREVRRKMSRIRKVIAQRLVEVKQTTAMLTTFNEVDLTKVMRARDKYKDQFFKKYGVKLGFMSFFVKAVIAALKEIPDLNSYIADDEIVTREYCDIGIAVGTDKGLVVPVVRNCEMLSFAQIEQAIEGYAKKAREGGLAVDDLQGGGFTITNGGVYGSLLSTPILNPPQSGILGMHKIVKRPVVVADEIVIRPMMYLALSYDHRIVDGKEAVTFLVHIKEALEDPTRLLMEV